MRKLNKKIVLGIDPGLASTGYGVIVFENKKMKLLDFGCINTPTEHSCGKRLQTITTEIKKIIKKYKPQFVSIEDIFFAKNAKTAIKVGQAKGAILLIIENSNIPVRSNRKYGKTLGRCWLSVLLRRYSASKRRNRRR